MRTHSKSRVIAGSQDERDAGGKSWLMIISCRGGASQRVGSTVNVDVRDAYHCSRKAQSRVSENSNISFRNEMNQFPMKASSYKCMNSSRIILLCLVCKKTHHHQRNASMVICILFQSLSAVKLRILGTGVVKLWIRNPLSFQRQLANLWCE